MKAKRVKLPGRAAFYGWHYEGSFADIEFFSHSKSQNEDILLPSSITGIIEFGNLQFSIPPEAILTMQVLKRRESHGEEFQSHNILIEQEIMRRPPIAQMAIQLHDPAPKLENPKEAQEKQKLTDHVLVLKDFLFKEIAERIAPLPTDATPAQRIAKLQENQEQTFRTQKRNLRIHFQKWTVWGG